MKWLGYLQVYLRLFYIRFSSLHKYICAPNNQWIRIQILPRSIRRKLLKKYKGDDQGIPYWFVFDKEGKLLADSKVRPEGGGLEAGENSGCPASEKEVAYFLKVLKETSSLKETELAIIRKRFRENEN